MNITKQIAKHFREVHFGGNWTVSCFKDQLADVNWQEATRKVNGLNTVAVLVFHTGYFVDALLDVLEGKPLTSNDKFSFDHPPIQSEEDWEKMKKRFFNQAEKAATLIEQLPDSKLAEDFADKKYGNYYRNLHGIIEHSHYHLGQIALIRKLIRIL